MLSFCFLSSTKDLSSCKPLFFSSCCCYNCCYSRHSCIWWGKCDGEIILCTQILRLTGKENVNQIALILLTIREGYFFLNAIHKRLFWRYTIVFWVSKLQNSICVIFIKTQVHKEHKWNSEIYFDGHSAALHRNGS